MSLLIEQIPVLTDNYIYLLHEPRQALTAVVDPAVSEPVLRRLAERHWRLTHIFNTHHHADHIGGNLELKQATGCLILGPEADRERIPGIDVALVDGEVYDFGASQAEILFVPGHTRGHIAFWFAAEEALFCGDTLFALGCGRLFEGTPKQMWHSLEKIRQLPPATRIYCAHEYTLSNARFAIAVEPDNLDLQARLRQVEALRRQNLPSVPSRLAEELASNPFLRADQPMLARRLGLSDATPVEVFAHLRELKDRFRG